MSFQIIGECVGADLRQAYILINYGLTTASEVATMDVVSRVYDFVGRLYIDAVAVFVGEKYVENNRT